MQKSRSTIVSGQVVYSANPHAGSFALQWSALDFGTATGVCESCGLPALSAANHYKVPPARGWFCSIRCVECVLFGPHRCRWCGKKLNASAQRFCDDACRHKSDSVPFGDGTRTL